MQQDKYTISEDIISVGNGHQLYVQTWGSKTAKQSIVFLHGGPGSGCEDKQKKLFDPKRDRVIFIDQRGCGKSTPAGSLLNNNTSELIEDINRVTKYLGINKFGIVGGSWGSCLALAYTLQYRERVEFLVIRGVLTGRKSEIDFVDKGLFSVLYPDVWKKYQSSVPKEFRENPSAYHSPRMLGADPQIAKKSAYVYATMENSLAFLAQKKMTSFEEFDPKGTIIENYYMANFCFLKEGYILQNAKRIKVPVYIVQGRYDVICPGRTAFELSEKLENSRLIWTIAGHSGSEPENIRAVRKALNELSAAKA